MELAQTNMKAMKDEVEGLRGRIRQAQADRDDQFAKVVALSDRLNQLEGNQRLLAERNRELTQSVAESTRVLERYGLSRNTPLHNVPPKVDGVVTVVRGSDLIELSLGADDGLRVGHRLDVYRAGGTYLGRVEVMYTDPDQSVARILPDFQQGIIRSGDTVATRLLDNVITTASAN